MDADRWSVLIVAREERLGNAIVRALQGFGVHPGLLTDSHVALAHPAREEANFFLVFSDAVPIAGVEWVRLFRRQRRCKSYKAPVVLLAPLLSPSLVDEARKAGANAIAGLPVSRPTLIKTIKRVFAQNTPFVDDEAYVGPCLNASMITAWPSQRTKPLTAANLCV
jgi:hypothetical protein